MRDELVHPGRLRRCRTSNTKLRVDRLYRLCGFVVQRKVRLLFGLSVPEIDVRFVPNLEVPLLNLSFAIALDQMPREGPNQSRPFLGILRGRWKLLVPEGMRSQVGREFARHETQLNEGTRAIFQ